MSGWWRERGRKERGVEQTWSNHSFAMCELTPLTSPVCNWSHLHVIFPWVNMSINWIQIDHMQHLQPLKKHTRHHLKIGKGHLHFNQFSGALSLVQLDRNPHLSTVFSWETTVVENLVKILATHFLVDTRDRSSQNIRHWRLWSSTVADDMEQSLTAIPPPHVSIHIRQTADSEQLQSLTAGQRRRDVVGSRSHVTIYLTNTAHEPPAMILQRSLLFNQEAVLMALIEPTVRGV